MNTDKFNIDRLDNTNYQAWKFQMKHLLRAKELYDIVEGIETPPAADADARVKSLYQSRVNIAFSTIALSISTDLIYLISDTEDPVDAWNKLRNHFERDTLANKLFLKKQYFRSTMQEGTSVSDHLKYMKGLTDKLAAIKAPITEEDQVVALLGSLPESFSTLVTALEARVDDLSLEFVQQSLRNEEQKRKEKKEVEHSQGNSDAALVVAKNRSSNSRPKQPPTCYNCQEKGHISRFCPKRQHKANQAASSTSTFDPQNESAFLSSVSSQGNNNCSNVEWIIDSGATRHMTSQKHVFTEYRELNSVEKVSLGDGHVLNATGIGNVKVVMLLRNKVKRIATLFNVLYVPDLAANLFSVRSAASRQLVMQFGHSRCWIKDARGTVRGMGTLRNDGLYYVDCEMPTDNQGTAQNVQTPRMSDEQRAAHTAHVAADLWHRRLAHASSTTLSKMCEENTLECPKISSRNLSFCESCAEGKASRKPFPTSTNTQTTRKLELIHSDICTMEEYSIGGSKYFVTFVDDFSRCCAVYFMKNKYELVHKLKMFIAQTCNSSNCSIGTLRSDRGGEYTSKAMTEYLLSQGIAQQLTTAYSPEQNGVAERMNRTLCEAARAMLFNAKLPKQYWAEAVSTAAYIKNRLPTRVLKDEITPYQKWYGRKPNINHLRVFGSMAYAHIPQKLRQKLDSKCVKLRFVGYSMESKAYRLLDESSNKILVRRDVTFNEQDFRHASEQQGASYLEVPRSSPGEHQGASNLEVPRSSPGEHQGASNLEVPRSSPVNTQCAINTDNQGVVQEVHAPRMSVELRRSDRIHQPPKRFGIDEYATTVTHQVHKASHTVEPETFKQAMESSQANQWLTAANDEYNSLIENETWKLTELPPGRTAIGCKWVFKTKHKSDGTVERYKGRLVAKGYAQQHGVDYNEVFSPVVRFASIRTLLAYGIQKGMKIHQMDVVTAFLNGKLTEDVYMTQPEGFTVRGKEHLVCKLQKSIYGLKQSPRCWNSMLDNYLKSLGFSQSTADQCVYIRNKPNHDQTIIAVYVDDLILLSDNDSEMNNIKLALAERFRMKDLGPLHYCLGVTIEQDDTCIAIHQHQYIQDILQRFGLHDANAVTTPADINVKLCKQDNVSKPVDSKLYQAMVGCLLYAAIATRPDICQAVGAVSKYNSQPTEAHLTAVKRIYRYLKGTADQKLVYRKTSANTEIVGYSDADWAGDLDSRHSTTGNVFLLAGGPVSWLSKQQNVVAVSTAEAEYVALFYAVQEGVWLQRLLSDIMQKSQQGMTIFADNQAAISIANNNTSNSRTKHIDIKYHFIREAVERGDIKTCHIPSKLMLADILTKPTAWEQFSTLLRSLLRYD